jgi:ABC-type glycerol-3-phosphate transport system substrate-binding protein
MTIRTLTIIAAALALAACSAFKPADKAGDGTSATSAAGEVPSARSDDVPTVRLITAQTPAVRAYRKTGARQIYKAYPQRIYKGKIPPLVYAVVVVETDIDAEGNVKNVTFSRVPSHAPEVPGKIAELIKAASPLPSPGHLGGHTYVDTWLWDKSGNFQLDSLTLGQRSR